MVVHENLECMHVSFFKFNKSSPGVVKNIFKNSYLGCCMAFKRSMLPYILPFPRFIPMHDWWIGLVLDSVGRVSFIDNKLILFRRHGENASMTASISPYSIKQKVVWRVCIAFSLILRLLRVL